MAKSKAYYVDNEGNEIDIDSYSKIKEGIYLIKVGKDLGLVDEVRIRTSEMSKEELFRHQVEKVINEHTQNQINFNKRLEAIEKLIKPR